MSVLDLTTSEFEDILANNKGILLLDFWAKWCGPCRSFATVYAEAAIKFPQAKFYKVDIEKEPNLATKFGIRSIPHLMIFNQQQQTFSEPGTKSLTDLDKLINESLKKDVYTQSN